NILINLITNAMKFSDEGKEIVIEAEINGNQAIVSVEDQGIGIGREDLAHLFSSFFRGGNAMNIAGTGLGLHIVKRYVDLLMGQVRVQSELNKGTKAYIVIPVNTSK
ncbi:MAG: ATP-binding protein, partial [Chitinophagaceae bacterium]|nr:ATP-binding protein [Chitinophagaceae bacterium]